MKNFATHLGAAVVLTTTLLAAPAAQAQIATPQASPKSTVTQRVGLTDVTITYYRPSAKGRTVFGPDKVVAAGAPAPTPPRASSFRTTCW